MLRTSLHARTLRLGLLLVSTVSATSLSAATFTVDSTLDMKPREDGFESGDTSTWSTTVP